VQEGTIEGAAGLGAQTMAGHEVVIERAAPQRPAFIVAVGGETVAVCHPDETHREPAGGWAQTPPEAIPEAAMREAGEAPADLAPAIWTKGRFFHPG